MTTCGTTAVMVRSCLSLYPSPSAALTQIPIRTSSTARSFLDLGLHPLPKCQRTTVFPTSRCCTMPANICVIKREACFRVVTIILKLELMSSIAVPIPAVIVTIVQPHLTRVDSQYTSPSVMRRSLSRRHSTYSTERCRYQCGVEKKRTRYLFCCVPIDGLACPK
ncbi:hypothetical protein BGY98DRAFT_256764 [Russula aff. rugulosa BPL654]|nr:hypothetical protein BGY98DRAFT_256764 [Russula aff. rugulosa BPL654]